MADKYRNFKSESELNARREHNTKARQEILEQAKRKYEREERRIQKAKKQGEGTWMLDSVNQRIWKEEKEIKGIEKKKKSKKKKKKKSKKRAKGSSSSEDSSDEEEQWVESSQASEAPKDSVVKGPQLQRDSWMESPLDLIPTISRQEIRDAVNLEKQKAKEEAEKMYQPGQHARELNPYWKDGGVGLPQEKPSKSSSAAGMGTAGDGGLTWLKKAYARCKQQAKEEGRSLEDVAAERWGSLKKLQSMLREAEDSEYGGRKEHSGDKGSWKNGSNKDRDSERDSYRNDRKERSSRPQMLFQQPSSDDEDERKGRSHSSRNDRRREGRNDDDGDFRRRRLGFRRPNSDSDDEHKEKSSSRDEKKKSWHADRRDDRRDEGSRRRESFKRPGSDDEEDIRRSHQPNSERDRRRDSDSTRSRDNEKRLQLHENYRSRRRSPEPNMRRWKKPSTSAEDKNPSTQKEKKTLRKSHSSDSSSSSSGSESDSAEEGQMSQATEEVHEPPQQKILSEEELNDLAAKILRAEIMGDEALAADLKSQLESARKLRESASSSTRSKDFSCNRKIDVRKRGQEEEDEENNVVVLSRTSKGGLVHPVQASEDEWGPSRGKRRKKNVDTHDKKGERSKFFDDDDKFSLKTLVEQEKAGTAEDQNMMFARLAGRSTDRDLDVDDMFVSKAAQKQSEEQIQIKDRAAAIMEHRKINTAMGKCQRCFDKVPKHLIIAIGTKCYLCLPSHLSLAEGHCYIVPMQHVSAATALDEDVWQEVQLFRKSLVQMFSAQDQDMVIMETVMHLKHFPHTAFECIPLDKEVGDLSPIYFKKAIQEVGPEWSDNKKLHDLSKKDIRHVVPKGFPYFSVDFGLQGGYAHVIEDEATFPSYFGREIVGGMLDAEPNLWRKPHKQSFEDQRKKVLAFEQTWKPYDWTQNLSAAD